MQDATALSLSQNDLLDPDRANALAATLELKDTFTEGAVLPPFFHQIYFWNALPSEDLGRDGHPKRGGLIPDMGLPRRMWAGGRLAFHAPLRAGIAARKTSRCIKAEYKKGRSGPFALVTLQHDIEQHEKLCLTEWQDLVYLTDRTSEDAAPVAPTVKGDFDTENSVTFDSSTLFRYSALTFNGHRIHYDLEYAKQVEGYGGLVVHGPLLAQLLMLKAESELGPLSEFSFRATAPLMHFEKAQFRRRGNELWCVGPDDRQCMIATAQVRSE